ncbi:MAG: putative ABC transporter permease [Oscillospiraceae bacterium]|nr:putative ABC transporter permease [Oscillospiraceae bacterium]
MADKRVFLTEKLPVTVSDFIICGFTGWVYETVLTSVVFGEFVDRGVLPIPILPIYALFALVLPFFFKRSQNPVFITLAGAAGATIFELICSYITERIWGYQLWSYVDWKFNFEGRISLFSSLIFGVMCVLFVKGIHPLSEYLQKRFGKGFAAAVYILAAVLAAICAAKLLKAGGA